MPIRDYHCPGCGNTERDVLKWGHDESPFLCSECGSNMNQVLSTFEPRFIGSGFYENDYKKKEKNDKKETDTRG